VRVLILYSSKCLLGLHPYSLRENKIIMRGDVIMKTVESGAVYENRKIQEKKVKKIKDKRKREK